MPGRQVEWGPLVPCGRPSSGQRDRTDSWTECRRRRAPRAEDRSLGARQPLEPACSRQRVWAHRCAYVRERVSVHVRTCARVLCAGIGTSVFVPVAVCPQQGHGKRDRCVCGPGGVRGVGDPSLPPDSGPGSMRSHLETPWPLPTPHMSFLSETQCGQLLGRGGDIFPPRPPFRHSLRHRLISPRHVSLGSRGTQAASDPQTLHAGGVGARRGCVPATGVLTRGRARDPGLWRPACLLGQPRGLGTRGTRGLWYNFSLGWGSCHSKKRQAGLSMAAAWPPSRGAGPSLARWREHRLPA